MTLRQVLDLWQSYFPNLHLQRTSEMKWHNESINTSCSCVVRFDWVMTQKKNMSHKLWKVSATFLSCFLIFIYPGSETLEIKYWFCKSVLGRDGKHVFPWKFNASMAGTCKLETQTEESCQCFSPCLEKAALTTERAAQLSANITEKNRCVDRLLQFLQPQRSHPYKQSFTGLLRLLNASNYIIRKPKKVQNNVGKVLL